MGWGGNEVNHGPVSFHGMRGNGAAETMSNMSSANPEQWSAWAVALTKPPDYKMMI